MFAWFRRIRRINIFGFELKFNHPPERPEDTGGGKKTTSVGPVTPPGQPPGSAASRPEKPKALPPGASFTAYGEVIKAVGKDLGIRVRNEAEIREFWRVNQVDTDLDWFGPGSPVVSIGRKQDVAKCKIGDEAGITFVVEDRAGGKRGIKTVAFEVRPRA
jgi:hypothetical protein